MEPDFAEIDVSREYFPLILGYGGPDYHFIKPRLFTEGIERFVFLKNSVKAAQLLSVLEEHAISYDCQEGGLVRKRVRFLVHGEGFFRTEVHNISLRDSRIRKFTDEEKALIMRYKIEQQGEQR